MDYKGKLQKSKFIYLGKVNEDASFVYNSINQNLIYGDSRIEKLINDLKSIDDIAAIKNKIKKIYASELVNNIYKVSQENGFLIPGNDSKLEKPETTIKDEDKNYKLLRILLTDVCNLNCEYCKVMQNLSPSDIGVSNNKRIDDVLKIFFEGSEADIEKTIHITGGEPLIYWNKVVYIVEQANKLKRKGEKIMFVVGTNGLLLDRNKIEYLKKNYIKVIVSLDGMGDTNILRKTYNNKNSFPLVSKSILMLKENELDFGISMVIGKHNLEDLTNTIGDIIEEYNPISLGVNFMKPPTKDQGKFPYLITPLEYVNSIYEAYKNLEIRGFILSLCIEDLYLLLNKLFGIMIVGLQMEAL